MRPVVRSAARADHAGGVDARAGREGGSSHSAHGACGPCAAGSSTAAASRLVTACVAGVVVAGGPDGARSGAAGRARCVPRPGDCAGAKYARLGVVVARAHA